MQEKARWIKDLCRFLPLKSQFVLSGNIHDLQAYEIAENIVTPQTLEQTLFRTFRCAGYENVLVWNPMNGFRLVSSHDFPIKNEKSFFAQIGLTADNGQASGGIDMLSMVLERLTQLTTEPVALVIDFASQIVLRADNLTAQEHQLFTRALVLSHSTLARPSGEQRKPFYNTVVWIVEKEGDLPDWFLINNPHLRHIPIPKPDQSMRQSLAPALLRGFLHASTLDSENFEKYTNEFSQSTEGMLLLDLNAIATLARVEQVPVHNVADAVRRYKVGVTEDPWQKIDYSRIKKADDFIAKRVKGQEHAVTHILDIVKRAITGVGYKRKGNRPRGVVFLAGPTGVGKTELAKSVTSLLFNDENAYIRFDMSEFSSEHADQRLIGAPPGYVGYDVGGELTNAIREKPFSVVLFDEIEKAHPRILDKFLQILDDGVLTSGRGERVYFSEALIIFTSNLGIYKVDNQGLRTPNVTQSDAYDAVNTKVRQEIERYFKLVLNRPEILNRIGENIVVFDFIRPNVAKAIFTQMVNNIIDDLRDNHFELQITPSALQALENIALADLSNGGRGIRNQIEAHLLNPLSRHVFTLNPQPNQCLLIEDVKPNQLTVVLK